MRTRTNIGLLVVAAAMAFSASTARAGAPLADGVPGDALFYIGWRGAETVGPAYERSHLKAISDASELTTAMRRIAPQIVAKIAEQDPQTGAIADLIVALGGAVWNYPTAIYFAMDPPNELDRRPPMPKIAVIVHAGADTEKIAAKVKQMMEGAPPDFRIATVGEGRIILTNLPVGAIDALNGGAGAGGQSLATTETFTKSLAATHADPVIVAYADVEQIVARFDAVMAAQKRQFDQAGRKPPRDYEQMMKMREVLAPEGVKRLTIAMGFEGPDWTTSVFVEAPGPRKGLAKLIEGHAIDEAALAVVPKTAAMAGASTLDLAGLFAQIRSTIREVDPRESERMERDLAEFERQIGMRVQEDLLAPFGKQWMYYTDAKVAGTGALGLVLINKLDDPAKADKALDNVAQIINGIVADALPTPELHVRIRTLERKGATIHYLAVPAIAPAWAVHDGYLYIGIQPQVVAGAIDFAKSGGESLRTSEKYIQMRASARGGGPITGFDYLDLGQKVNDAYAINVLVMRYLTGFGDLFGVDAPPMAVPPLTDILPHLSPSMAVGWTDDAGLHIRHRTPFPLADLLASEQNLSIAPTALAVGILLPSLSRAREIANRSKSGANLSGLYKAMYTWSVTNKDKFPPDFATMVKEGLIGPMQVVNPRTGNPGPPPGLDLDGLARWADQNSDYVVRFGKVGAASPADELVAYERIVPGIDEGINILRGDGSVTFVNMFDAVQMLHKFKEPIPEDYKWMIEENNNFGPPRGDAGPAPRGPVAARPVPPPKKIVAVSDAYFYDVKTKTYFTDKATKIAPIVSPDGNEGIRAHFFTCGECNDAEKFLGYYEKYDPEVKAKIENNPNDAHFFEEVFRGRYYCPPNLDPTDNLNWVAAETPEGFEIAQALQAKCPARKLRYCPPPRK